jgi:hypothetical protein
MFNRPDLFQFIVPLTFLAIWALTSLLNREAQPLPPRTGRPQGPPGPRPGPVNAPRPLERRPELGARDPGARWSVPAPQPRPAPGRPANRADDEILIIESEPRRSPAPPGPRPPAASSSQRRGNRARSNPAPAPKRQEPPTPRALTAAMVQENQGPLGRQLELSPLLKMQAPLSQPVSQEAAAGASAPPTPSAGLAPPSSREIQTLLTSPARLREAFVVSELLGPPLALRGTRPRTP